MARKPRNAAAAAAPLAIQYRPLDDLQPDSRNARTHSRQQLDLIKGLLRRLGWTTAIGIAGAGILAGHARWLAARELRDEGVAIPRNPDPNMAPTVDLSALSAVDRRAYIVADNQIALQAGWNSEILASELAELRAHEVDLAGLGFTPAELLRWLPPSGKTDPDSVPEPPELPTTRKGDVWICGDSRVICGDCTDPAVVARVLAGRVPRLMVTDPPYGVKYDPAWRVAAGLNGPGAAAGLVENDDRSDWREAWALFPGAIAYVWHGGLHAGAVMESLTAARFQLRAQIVWVKSRISIGRGHYHWQHEPCLYGVREGEADDWRFVPEHEIAAYAVREGDSGDWAGGRKQSTVWSIEVVRNTTGHSTQKPVECMRRPIENNSEVGGGRV